MLWKKQTSSKEESSGVIPHYVTAEHSILTYLSKRQGRSVKIILLLVSAD